MNTERLWIALQPIMDLETRQVSHFEALVRLGGPVVDGMPPHVGMLECAEAEGWIGDVDMRVLEQALAVLERSPLNVAVNLSPTSVESVGKRFLEVIADHQWLATRLVVEITETAPVRDIGRLCEFLSRLKRLGGRVALDDYGNGQGYITDDLVRAVRPDYLKLDGTVLDDGMRSRRKMAGALMLGAQTGAQIIAEFVDSIEKVEFLELMQIRYAQGAHFGMAKPWSKPVVECRQGCEVLRGERCFGCPVLPMYA